MNYLYGFTSAAFVYWALSYWFPAEETILQASIYDDTDVIDGVHLAQQSGARTTSITRDGSKSQIAVYYTDPIAGDGKSQGSSRA